MVVMYKCITAQHRSMADPATAGGACQQCAGSKAQQEGVGPVDPACPPVGAASNVWEEGQLAEHPP